MIEGGQLPGMQVGFLGFFDTVPGFHLDLPGGGTPGAGMTSIPPSPGKAFFESDASMALHRGYHVSLPSSGVAAPLQAIHFVALDETRTDFAPLSILGAGQFGGPGAHSDVGGGYANKGLSNAYLQMMVDAARRSGSPMQRVELPRTSLRMATSTTLVWRVVQPRIP